MRVGGILTVERTLIRHVVNKQYTHCASVICSGDGPEPLLSSGISYLQLDSLAVQLDRPDLEIDTDGGDEGRGERVFTES